MFGIFNGLFGFLGKDLAMDLGTASSLLYTVREGIVLNEPSVVAMDVRENKITPGATPRNTWAAPRSGSRPSGLKDEVIADFEITKEMISFFVKKVIEEASRVVKPRIVVACPPA